MVDLVHDENRKIRAELTKRGFGNNSLMLSSKRSDSETRCAVFGGPLERYVHLLYLIKIVFREKFNLQVKKSLEYNLTKEL